MPCIVCHATSEAVVWKENGYEGRLCACGTVYISPEPEPGIIDPRLDTHSDTFYSRYATTKARWVQRFRPSGRLLEIGCGEGHFLRAAKSLGYAVAGVESDPERARRVREQLGIEVRCSLLEDLEWQKACFDVVYHCDLLSHFLKPVQALRKMSSLLAADGVVVCEAGTLGAVHPFWYRWTGQVGFPQHRWLYCPESLHRLFVDAGMQIVQMQHFGLAPAVIMHRSFVLAAGLIRRLRRKSLSEGRKTRCSTSGNREFHQGTVDAIYDVVDQFFRYRIGAIAPRLGPATWWIAARPALDERSECKPDRAQPSKHERSECKRDSAQPSKHERSECKPDSAQPSKHERSECKRGSAQPLREVSG
jgi:SAM-dependent methyltransferase